MMMDQFSLSSETAYNLITQGAQKGLNKNDDLLDTINEYSVHFKQLGFSADEMFNMLENGAKSGTFSVDKLGDTIKEFGIRAIDGSDTTVTAFKMAGLNADSMAKKFSKGGSDAKEAFTETIKALKDMKDPIEQNTAGVNLFGTMWEDLGAKGVFAISNLNGEISSTSDALEKMNEVKYEDLGSTFTVFGRNIMSSFTEGITSDSGDLIESIRDLQEKIMPDIKEAGEVVGNIVEKGIDGIDYITKHTELFKVSLSGVIGLLSAKKAINGITGLASGLGTTIGASTKVGGALTTVASKLGSIALPATLAVGGITAVTAGFQAYTNWAKQKDLEKHFGSVSLSMQEVEDIADKIVANGNMSKIRSSLEEFSKVDTIKKNIDEAKSSIDKFDWKIDMGFKLSAEDNNDYKKSIESYISEVQSYVEQRHYSMNISAQMIFGDSKEGKEITKTLNTFYSSQETELKKCGEDLQSVINKAFEDGLLDFDEQKKIEELTAKMTKIKKAIEDNKFDANLEIIGSDYSDKKLSADSFKDMQGEVNENIETVRQANKESHQNLIIDIKNAYANNPEQMKYRLAEADKAYKIADASYVGKGVEIEANTIHNSYKQDIDKGYEVYNRGFNARNYGKQIAEAIDSSGSDVKKSYENLDNLIEMEAQNMETAWASMSSSTQKNISEMYNSLKPEQSQLTETATACIDAGKNIPESIAQGILDSAAVGAVVGNTDSIYIRTAYNMTQQNPAYAEAMLAAKESGIEVPNSIMLGIELAKPGAISKATEAGTETGAAAKNGMANTKAGVKASTENAIGNGMCEGIDNARSKIATKIQQLKSYVETALNIGGTATVTGPDGTKTSTTFEMKAKGIATNAEGGIYDSPLLTWVAEAGDAEAIIPLNNSQRAYDLWQEAGMRLGTIRGFDDSQPLNITANTSDIVNDKDVMGVYSSAVNKTIVLKLEGGGEIKIPSTMDKNEVLNLLTSNLKPVLLGIINQELFEEGDGAYVT